MPALEMRIRCATAEDIPVLMKLERCVTSAAHWSIEQYATAFCAESPSRVMLMVEEAGVRGFIVGRELGEEWEIENIAVAETVRRRGFGARLLENFLSLARDRGAKKVFLEVRESNSAARRLYEKWAFVDSGRRKLYYREPEEDAIVYQLDLS